MINKLTSRKLWLSIAGVATGIAMALGVDASEVQTVAGSVLSIISIVSYIIIEGKVDAERVKNTIVQVQEAVEVVEKQDE